MNNIINIEQWGDGKNLLKYSLNKIHRAGKLVSALPVHLIFIFGHEGASVSKCYCIQLTIHTFWPSHLHIIHHVNLGVLERHGVLPQSLAQLPFSTFSPVFLPAFQAF